MPRVCMLVEPFYPVIHGGAELQAWQLCHQLIQQGVSVIVVTRRLEPTLKSAEVVDGLSIYRVPPSGPRNHFFKLLEVFTLTWFLVRNRQQYDLLHVHDVRSLFVTALLVRFLTRKPFLVKPPMYGDVSRRPPQSTQLSLYSRILYQYILPPKRWQRLLRQASGWVAISSEIADELAEIGLSERTKRISNAVETERFRPATAYERRTLRTSLNLPPDCIMIVSHGRITPRKRLDMLLRAVIPLREIYPDLVVVLPGDVETPDDYKKQLDELIRLHNLQVYFPGPTSTPEDYLRVADIFVLSSEREGMPNALLEAMACGLPVVASAIGGVVDLISDRENGLLFPVDDEKALTETLKVCLSDPQKMAQLGTNALRTIEQNYTWSIVIQRYLNLYEQVMALER